MTERNDAFVALLRTGLVNLTVALSEGDNRQALNDTRHLSSVVELLNCSRSDAALSTYWDTVRTEYIRDANPRFAHRYAEAWNLIEEQRRPAQSELIRELCEVTNLAKAPPVRDKLVTS